MPQHGHVASAAPPPFKPQEAELLCKTSTFDDKAKSAGKEGEEWLRRRALYGSWIKSSTSKASTDIVESSGSSEHDEEASDRKSVV